MISIIIVNYNSGNLVSGCVKSIIEHIDLKFEIIVVDNNSSDQSIEILKALNLSNTQLKIVETKVNHGFAKGNNIGVEHSKGSIIHFLNPDIIVNKKLNEHYQLILNDEKDKIFVTTLTDLEGRVRKSKHLIPTLSNYIRRLFRRRNILYWDIGASVIMKKTVFDSIGKWEERYFMYAEDLDLFYTAHQKRIKISYLDTQIIHIEKGCSTNVWDDFKRASIIENSFKLFYKKHRMLYQYYLIRPMQLVYMLFNDIKSFRISIVVFFKSLLK